VIHPFYSTLLTQPGLLVEHLDAYVDLAKAEADSWGSALTSRWILRIVVAICAMLAMVLAAIAAMLAGAIDGASMPHAWVLLAVPAVPALVALGAWWRLRSLASAPAFAMLRAQLATDLAIMKSADRD